MKNFAKLFSCFILFAALFVSCSKNEDNNLDNAVSTNTEISELTGAVSGNACLDLNCVIEKINDFDYSKEYDAMAFHTSFALQSLIAENAELRGKILSLVREENVSVNSLFEGLRELKAQMNSEIRLSINQHPHFAVWNNTAIGESMEAADFDFLTAFDRIIAENHRERQLVFYAPLERTNVNNESEVLFGVDVNLPDENQALLLNSENLFITEDEAESSSNPIVFVSVSETEEGSSMSRGSTTIKLDKWKYYGKVERIACTTNCDIDYTWYHKKKWLSSWKFASAGSLTQLGEISTTDNSPNRRIKITVRWLDLSNFALYQGGSVWQQIY